MPDMTPDSEAVALLKSLREREMDAWKCVQHSRLLDVEAIRVWREKAETARNDLMRLNVEILRQALQALGKPIRSLNIKTRD